MSEQIKSCENCTDFSKCGVINELGEEIIKGTNRKTELAEVCVKHCISCKCSARNFNIDSAIQNGVLDTCCVKYGSKSPFCNEHRFNPDTES
jgi:hypothetical protein